MQASDRVLRDQQQAAHHQHLKQSQWDTDARLARSTIDLAARVGELALATGATSADATHMTLQVARSSGLNVHINITFTCVTITEHRVEGDPITTMRVVKARTVDYERLSRLVRLVRLVDRFSRGLIDLEQARSGFDGLLDTSPNYRFWVLSLSAFVMGASMTVLLGGNWQTTLAAGFATTAADLLVGWSVRKGLPYFFVIALAAAVPTVCALTVMALRAYTTLPVSAISPSLIVAAGMMSLLAGLGVVTAAREAIDGYYITAGARTFEVIVLTMAIVLGLLATGLALASGSTLGNFLARPIPELQLRGRRGVVHAPATGS